MEPAWKCKTLQVSAKPLNWPAFEMYGSKPSKKRGSEYVCQHQDQLDQNRFTLHLGLNLIPAKMYDTAFCVFSKETVRTMSWLSTMGSVYTEGNLCEICVSSLRFHNCTYAWVELFSQNGIASIHPNLDRFSSPLKEEKNNSIKVTLY